MQIHTFYFNPYRECTYVVYPDNSKEAIVVDAGMYGEREQERFAQYIAAQQLRPVALLITHAHPDHVCGQQWLEQQYGLQAVVYPEEGVLDLPEPFAGRVLVLRTPGHKEDSVCYHFPNEQWLFTGDTLFQESIGRTDLPGGDMGQLIASLGRLQALPQETTVWPGHGYSTTIAHERMYNPYLG